MSCVFRVRPMAHDDVVGHYLLIQADQPAAADRFLDVLDEAYQTLLAHPFTGRAYPADNERLLGLRLLRMSEPYRNFGIFYQVSDDAIEVVRVLHGSMNITPDFFKSACDD